MAEEMSKNITGGAKEWNDAWQFQKKEKRFVR
jgi:hypothetical protein